MQNMDTMFEIALYYLLDYAKLLEELLLTKDEENTFSLRVWTLFFATEKTYSYFKSKGSNIFFSPLLLVVYGYTIVYIKIKYICFIFCLRTSCII